MYRCRIYVFTFVGMSVGRGGKVGYNHRTQHVGSVIRYPSETNEGAWFLLAITEEDQVSSAVVSSLAWKQRMRCHGKSPGDCELVPGQLRTG
jgi:hypothetical protein